jgi:DNA-binding transcriptional ArsR family regulator
MPLQEQKVLPASAEEPSQNRSFGENGEEQEQATEQVSRPAPGNLPTYPVHATGAEKRPLTSLHDLCILNSMVNDSSEQLTTVFLALADPTRRAILARLTHGEASGTELARPFSISVPAISKHLRVLEHAELILHRKDGRTHRFRLAARPMQEAAAWLEHYRQFWEAQFDSLDTYLQVTPGEEQDPDDPFSIS